MMRALKQFMCVLFLIGLSQSVATSSVAQVAAPAKETATETKIDQFSWIAGHWRGKAMGGVFEETWNPPMGGEMMGMFKFVKDGKVVFYEILTIVPAKDGSFVLRLKHFGKGLVGWEEKDKSVEFPLKNVNGNLITFDGLVFKKISKDQMKITVKTKSGGKVSELVFPCKRFQKKN